MTVTVRTSSTLLWKTAHTLSLVNCSWPTDRSRFQACLSLENRLALLSNGSLHDNLNTRAPFTN